MILRLLAKLYELLLRTTRPIGVEYFCKLFNSRPLPIVSLPASVKTQVRIFIPFKDSWEVTERCLNALLAQRNYRVKMDITLISNNSSQSSMDLATEWISGQANRQSAELITFNAPFNFSKICNLALSKQKCQSPSSYYLFLNNDVLLEQDNSLDLVTEFAETNPDCGPVGVTLLYPSRKIQHLFAAPGVKIIAAHPFKGRSPSILKDWNLRSRQVPAITGAFLMIASEAFHEAGGFDENLPTTGQDIDFCLRLQIKGRNSWVVPSVQAIHLESVSRRGQRISKLEVDYIHKKWKSLLTSHPDLPNEISRWSEQPVYRLLEGAYPYQLLLPG